MQPPPARRATAKAEFLGKVFPGDADEQDEKNAVEGGAVRVVNTGSFVYKQGRYDPDNLQAEKRFSTNASYAATKLYNLMLTRALARHWLDTDITINCFSPGFVATGFGRGEGGLLEPIYRFTRLFAISPEKGAATLVYLADSADVAGVSGGYFEKCRERDVQGPAMNAVQCEALLAWSARMTGFDADVLGRCLARPAID